VESSKSITSSRSFGRKVTALSDLREAVASYMARAAVKLRRQGLLTNVITVFIGTSRFVPAEKRYQNSGSLTMPESFNDTTNLTKYALIILDSIYRDSFQYNRAGVMLLDLVSVHNYQPSLFGDHEGRIKNNRLMETVDQLNLRMGSGRPKV
jgi:DNA polymerase V